MRNPSTAFAPAGSRSGKLSISFDDADKQIEEKLAFGGSKRRKNALLTSEANGANPVIELLSLRRQSEETCAPVASVDATLQKAFLFELCDQQAHVIAVNADSCS